MSTIKGQALPKETWKAAAENIKNVAPAIAERLRKMNFEGQGKKDAEEFITDMQLAVMAMTYVAEFARDKCLVIVVPEKHMN